MSSIKSCLSSSIRIKSLTIELSDETTCTIAQLCSADIEIIQTDRTDKDPEHPGYTKTPELDRLVLSVSCRNQRDDLIKLIMAMREVR
jgi:hypothetical protein